MRAAKFHGGGRITIEEVADPVPRPGEVGVKVAACALCGSDFRPWRQGWPVTSGHEIAGRIDEPGHPRHGERVVVYIPVFCGRCEDCRAGRTQLCSESRELIGWQRPGGYAERLAAPERCLLPVPDDISDRLAPLLLDTIGTTAHGVRLARRLLGGGKALVLGAGPIGLGAVIALARLGFGPIQVIDPNAYRAEVAASLGATPTDSDRAATGRYRLVIEATGKDAARQLALEAVGPEGAIVQLGESEAWTLTETRSIRLKDFFLIRSFYFPIADYAANIELLRADRGQYERLVDGTAGLDGLEALFQAFARGERLKPELVPPMKQRIVCVGNGVLDQVYEVEALPRAGVKTTALAYRESGGGPAATAAVAIARLGGHSSWWGRVGDDAAGLTLRELMTRHGVDLAGLAVLPGARTTRAIVMVDRKGERSILVDRLAPSADASILAKQGLEGVAVLLADTRWPEGAEHALRLAHDEGVVSVLDADGGDRPSMRRLAALAGHVVFSEEGLEEFAGAGAPEEGLRRAAKRLPGLVAVTHGAAGSSWWIDGRVAQVAAFPVAARDTTGCGDVFHGAYALRLAEGEEPLSAARFASAAAALKAAHGRGWDGMPDRAEVERLLKESDR